MKSGVIEVGVYGGLVQWVKGIPQDLEVKVRDYDVDGTDPGLISRDQEGNRCVVVIYRGCDEHSDILEGR